MREDDNMKEDERGMIIRRRMKGGNNMKEDERGYYYEGG